MDETNRAVNKFEIKVNSKKKKVLKIREFYSTALIALPCRDMTKLHNYEKHVFEIIDFVVVYSCSTK